MNKMIKKSMKLALIITIIINAICLVTNLICAYTINSIPLGLEISGGDCIEYIGFGIYLLKIFPMTSNEQIVINDIRISFHFISLLITLVLVFIISFIIIVIINKIRENKKK